MIPSPADLVTSDEDGQGISLSRLYNLNLRLWYLALEQIGPMPDAVEQHRAVLQAIKEHDSQKAEAAIREHIADFQERIRAMI